MESIRRFFKKSNAEKYQAARAHMRAMLTSVFKPNIDEIVAKHKLSAPSAVKNQDGFFLVLRPESDFEFNNFPELKKLVSLWVKHNRRNSGDIMRLYAFMLNIRNFMDENVPGDFAELGVWKGNSAAVLSHYARAYGRKTFLFDTFSGFDRRDLKGVDFKYRQSKAFSDTSLELVKDVVGDNDVVYVKGYFPDSIPESIESEAKFSLVHLDCDLYEPISSGLKFFYPRLSPGGMIIIHDYSNPHWAGVKLAVNEFLFDKKERPVLVPDRSGTAIIRKSSF